MAACPLYSRAIAKHTIDDNQSPADLDAAVCQIVYKAMALERVIKNFRCCRFKQA